MPIINIPGVGDVVLVDREQLRFKQDGRTMRIPFHLKAVLAEIPPPPATFDWSLGEKLKFPMLGNDRYGDCFYAAVAHGSQAFTGNAGQECSFDLAALEKRYLYLSGGDNGLSDSDILPEWKSGIVGPNGPRKVFDTMTIDPADTATMNLALWAFCGGIWTCSLGTGWGNNAGPGVVWDVSNYGRNEGGHAMWFTGVNSVGYDVRTWGISPPVKVTKAGILHADSEVLAAFSLDMFSPAGVGPCGANYDQLADLWVNMGGKTPPPNPFPPAPPLDWLVAP